MELISSFFVGVASSFVASYILYLGGFFAKITPPKLRKSFDKEYKNQGKAIRAIIQDAKKSGSIRVLALKGDTFSSPGKAGELHSILLNGPTQQRFLISNPDNPYILQRGQELKNENLILGVQNSIACFEEESKRNPNIVLRLHNEIVRFRLIIFEHCLYISFQSTDTPGRQSPMQRYIKPSSGYSALEAYFEDLWKRYEN